MNSIYLLVPLSLALVGIAVWAFFWAVDRGQFEDLEDGARAALEEDPSEPLDAQAGGTTMSSTRIGASADAASAASRPPRA